MPFGGKKESAGSHKNVRPNLGNAVTDFNDVGKGTMSKKVLVLGAGIAGLTSSVELARLGVDSVLVDHAPDLGGHAAKFSCKATDFCQRCGVCLLEDLLGRVAESDRIRVMTETSLVGLAPDGPGFKATLCANHETGQEESAAVEHDEMDFDAVILATGFSPYDAREKSRFGYGRVPGVFTGIELEAGLRDGSWVRNPDEKVAFIQCVGSRDPKIGRNYCSRVCCAYALRMAKGLKRSFGADISIFFMDLQSYERFSEKYLGRAYEDFRLIRAIPSEIAEGSDGKPLLTYSSTENKTVAESFDKVILSVGMSPNSSNRSLEELLSVGLNTDGFIGKAGEEARTSVEGVYVAGSAQGPRSIPETVTHAIKSVGAVAAFLNDSSGGRR
jgi:heterodisulfide reductase subunit A2